MRFLVDNALPPKLARLLTAAGHDAIHVRHIGMPDAEDSLILARALSDERIIVSCDSDFGTLLALHEAFRPSFILFRASNAMAAEEYTALLLPNLPILEGPLQRGAIVVFRGDRLRIRSLPITAQPPPQP